MSPIRSSWDLGPGDFFSAYKMKFDSVLGPTCSIHIQNTARKGAWMVAKYPVFREIE